MSRWDEKQEGWDSKWKRLVLQGAALHLVQRERIAEQERLGFPLPRCKCGHPIRGNERTRLNVSTPSPYAPRSLDAVPSPFFDIQICSEQLEPRDAGELLLANKYPGSQHEFNQAEEARK